MERVENYNKTAVLMDKLQKEGKAFVIRPQIPTISKFEQDSRKIMELYRHGYTLMDKRLMELVDWNQGKEVQHFEPVSAQVPDEGDVLLASG